MKNKVLQFILINALILVGLVVCIIPTLFYTQVPINQQHMWFGNDLHQYLIYQHSLITIVWFIFGVLVNCVLIKKLKD